MRLPLQSIVLLVATFSCFGCGHWPPVVHNSREIKELSKSTPSVRARGLPDSDVAALATLGQLRYLSFTSGRGAVKEAKLTDAGLAELAALNLPHLDTLTLGYCDNISDAGMSHVARLRSLRYLSLMACPRITDAGLTPLLSMESLTGLDLRGCAGITDDGLEQLMSKKNWETIVLGGCPNVTPEAVARLQRALPKADVQKDDVEWRSH